MIPWEAMAETETFVALAQQQFERGGDWDMAALELGLRKALHRDGCTILWAASATDGSKLAEYTMDELPAWDGMAAAYGKLFISNQDGSIECWGVDTGSGWNAFTLGNASVRSGTTDTNSNHNLVINETDTYTNTSGGEQRVWIKQFTFDTVAASTNEHVLPVAGVVTPFVVKVNGDNDFTGAAVGETRTATAIGRNTFAFADVPTVVNLASGETLAAGFLDAQANGSDGLGAVVRYDADAPTDENWHTGERFPAPCQKEQPPHRALQSTRRWHVTTTSISSWSRLTPTPTPTHCLIYGN